MPGRNLQMFSTCRSTNTSVLSTQGLWVKFVLPIIASTSQQVKSFEINERRKKRKNLYGFPLETNNHHHQQQKKQNISKHNNFKATVELCQLYGVCLGCWEMRFVNPGFKWQTPAKSLGSPGSEHTPGWLGTARGSQASWHQALLNHAAVSGRHGAHFQPANGSNTGTLQVPAAALQGPMA